MFDTFDDLVGASDNSSLDSFDLQISIGDYDNESTTSSFEFMDVKLALKSFIILNNSGEMETVKSKRFKKPSLVQTTDFFGIEFEDASYENRITRIRFQDILLVQRQWDFMVNFYFGQAPSMSVWDTLNDEFRSVTPANNDTPFRLCHYLQCALSGHVPNRAALPSDVTRDDKESTNMNSAFEYSQNDADPDETRSPTEKNLDVVFEYVKNNLFDLHEDTPNVFYYEKNIFVSLEEVKETSDRFSLVDSTDSLERYLQPAAAYQTSATQPRNKTQNPLDANAEESEDEEDEEDEDEEDQDTEDSSEETEENNNKGKYTEFWNQFGTNIRLGILEDIKNRDRLSKLLRYYSTKSGDELTSLSSYVKRMKENQKDIYFISGDGYDSVKDSPYLDKLRQKDYEVLFFIDPIDEYVAQSLTTFDDHKLVNVAREGLKLDEDDEKSIENKKEEFKPLTKFLKDNLGSNIEKAIISDRVVKIPCMLSSSQWGLTANQERIMKAQALGDKTMLQFMKSRKVMELNPDHPLVRQLRVDVMKEQNLDQAKERAKLLYDTALLQSGFSIEDTTQFAASIHKMLSTNLDEKELEKQEEEIRIEEEKKEEEEEDEVQGDGEEENEGHDEL
eukprot:gb/GECH01012128.1/.p1 GENE.gb/GECH01012128.1/~~gb/GECH01012128.1/.p1  ORF type:complete len:618 (+),score=197.01 gb/GECH01012128.1/:1-1854(+)